MNRMTWCAAATALVLACAVAGAAAKSIKDVHGFEPHFVLPPGANMVSVKDLGAVGDGKTDDTEAFKKAFENDAPRGIYIPAGTYLVRDALVYGLRASKKKRTCVMGESRTSAILRLADGAPGFGDRNKPKAFIHTRHPKQQGEQNMHMYLYHLTIEIGKNNPGAVALNYHSNNTGAIKDVEIRAADRAHPGHTGIACWDWGVGDAIARYVTVDGFQTGVSLTKVGNYFTVEHLTVRNCETGVAGGTFSLRGLTTQNCRVPLRSTGMTVLVDAALTGTGDAAVINEKGGLLARNIRTSGYAKAISSKSPSGDAAGPDVAEYVSDKVAHNWPPEPGMGTTLNLPVEESPELQYPQTADDWAVMPTTGDIAEAMQKAIDEGKKTIYIPGGGGPLIGKTVHLRNRVERVMCVGVGMVTCKTGEEPVFIVENGAGPVVILELIYANYGSKFSRGVIHASPRTVVLRHGSLSYETAPGGAGGKLFAESIVSHLICRKVHAWLRDMDTEAGGPDALNLSNEGGVMWVLGQKTEDFATKLRTTDGFTELLGGVYRENWDQSDFNRSGIKDNDRPPLFEAVNSNVSYTFSAWGPAKKYVHLVRETRGGETRNLDRAAHPGGAALFVGYTQRPPK